MPLSRPRLATSSKTTLGRSVPLGTLLRAPDCDSRMVRLIQKWLKAGVLEDGIVSVSETGTGQSSVISSLLSNVYLHYTFDLWECVTPTTVRHDGAKRR